MVCFPANEHNLVYVWYMAECQVILIMTGVHFITGLFVFPSQFITKAK